MKRAATRSARLLLLATLFSCGGSADQGRVRGTDLGEEVEAPGAGADAYATTPSPGAVLGDQRAEAVERGVLDAARSENMTLEPDGRLALLCAWLAENMQTGARLPPAAIVSFFAQHLGLPEPTPHILLMGQGDPTALASSIRDGTIRYLRRQHYDAYGAAVVERQGLTIAIVALSARPFEMRPVPRAMTEGQPIVVHGRLDEGWSQPRFAITLPDGSTERLPAGTGPQFDVNIPTNIAGVHRVELLADGADGPNVLANFPVYVGVPVPTSVRVASTDAEASTQTPAEVGETLLSLINEARRADGKPPLEAHAGVAAVSAAHSLDMRDNGFVAHRSPTTGEPRERLDRAGITSGLVLENIGRGYSAAEIHEGLMSSPGHRAAILNPDVTHVGIGVVVDPGRGRDGFLVTEVFLRINRAIDATAAPEVLLARINQARDARGARPLELDQNLQAAAAQAARDYFTQPTMTQQDAIDQASGAVRRFAIAFRRIGGVMAIVTTLEEAATLEPTFDTDLRFVGIGVAQGDRPDQSPGSIAVVILLAWPR
jgi:uncharacterized protein YkwD